MKKLREKTKPKAGHSRGSKWQVDQLRVQLDDLYARADPRTFEDQELASDLARYLCVRVAGFLEQATGLILREFCEKGTWGGAQRFTLSCLDRIPNLRAEALITLVDRFDSSWASECRELLSVEERGSKLNSLIGIRNDVAHGKNQGISREQAWSYYEVVTLVVGWLQGKTSLAKSA